MMRNDAAVDYRNVEELTREAFWNHHVPRCDEHRKSCLCWTISMPA